MAEAHENGHDARRRRTRRALQESASQLFDAQGYESTTVAQIARRADVSERTFYMHFPTKEDLLFAHVGDYATLAARTAHETASPHAVERVRAGMQALIDASTSDAAVARQAAIRAAIGARGDVPRALATQLIHLARGLAVQVSADTGAAVADVAPMVGAALGAVEGAGLDAGLRGIAVDERRAAMLRALDAALRGFREPPVGASHPSG
ncbi:TetR/AcrR family transcriptional regulator [Microbacterium sp. p3-SID336]|uniref:TetR/AcrR family transcriptional regulator n=1 Tax=Microbacterium sp. p3-SID336 TaxID=2916212 RepID=UPI0021A707BD|nr:TetR/AcrR family transcriptional regulator [Microbacterium sp. p3-SID336]MCT1478854.1 TetR/AcrR family transcriptional regulator [Microbacterium sp. p3-SID336]